MEASNKTPPASKFTSPNIKSPSDTPAEYLTTLGGMPPTKDVEAIAKENSPTGRSRAPDASGI